MIPNEPTLAVASVFSAAAALCAASALAVWCYYNGRADCENVIKELQPGFALPTLCLEQFWATEAALSLASLTYNLTVLFQRQLGWQQKVTLCNLRFWLFVPTGLLSHPAGKTTVKLAVPQRERAWWRRLWEKILSPFPNCNAVENRPTYPHEFEIPTAWIRLNVWPSGPIGGLRGNGLRFRCPGFIHSSAICSAPPPRCPPNRVNPKYLVLFHCPRFYHMPPPRNRGAALPLTSSRGV
jgi:hypothetical protein